MDEDSNRMRFRRPFLFLISRTTKGVRRCNKDEETRYKITNTKNGKYTSDEKVSLRTVRFFFTSDCAHGARQRSDGRAHPLVKNANLARDFPRGAGQPQTHRPIPASGEEELQQKRRGHGKQKNKKGSLMFPTQPDKSQNKKQN